MRCEAINVRDHRCKEKLSTLIQLASNRFGTDFDAQELIDGGTKQLLDNESVQRAAWPTTAPNCDDVGGPALGDARVHHRRGLRGYPFRKGPMRSHRRFGS